MSSAAPPKPSVGLNSITWPFRVALWLITFLLSSWGLAMVMGVVFHYQFWPHMGADPFNEALQTLFDDALQASTHFSLNAAKLTLWLSNGAYQLVFVMTGLETAYFRAITGQAGKGLDAGLYRWLADQQELIEALMAMTRLYGARMAMMLGALPLLVLAYVTGMVDGLVARHIRKEGGGRESSWLYHRAKWAIITLSGTAIMVVLLVPINYSPSWVLPIGAATLGVLVRMQWAYFKKYL